MSELEQSELHAETQRRLGEYLGELFDETSLFLDPETDHYYAEYGSTVIEISVGGEKGGPISPETSSRRLLRVESSSRDR